MAEFDYLLNAQPVQLPDPVAQAQRMMSLAQIANANQLAQYNLAKAQRADAAARATGQALGSVNLYDDNSVQQALQGMDPDARQAFLTTVMQARKEKADADKSAAQAGHFGAQTTDIQNKLVGSTAAFLAQKPDLSMQDILAANANAKRMGLNVDFTPPPGADPKSYFQTLAQGSVSADQQAQLAGQAATRAETAQHNRATETLGQGTLAETTARDRATAGYQQGELANSNMRARAAMVQADPFGLSGLNTSGAGGAPGMPAAPSMPQAAPSAPPLPQGVNPGDAELFKVALADAQKNGYPQFKVGGQTFNTADLAAPAQSAAGMPAPQAAPAQGAMSVQQAMQAGLHGDDFLAALPPNVAPIVKAMIEGRQAPPSGAGLRSPQIQQLMMLANQADPTFDQTSWGARAAMAKDWGDQGAIGKSNLAINTVIGHLGDLQKSANALNNTSFTPLNSVVNTVEGMFGDPRYKEFEANAGAVAKELERAYRGTGGSQGDIDAMKGELSSAGSPQQLTGVIQKYVDLLQSKIEANADAYRKTMGRDPPPLLSPKAQSTRDTLAAGQSGQAPVKINGDDGYNALPSGTLFVGPDGITRRKP